MLEEFNINKEMDIYKKGINLFMLDVPIQTFCFPKDIEKMLLKHNLTRGYELVPESLIKVKGLTAETVELILYTVSSFAH